MHIRLEANATYDVSDPALWPFDFGATSAAVVIEGDGSVLDARGLTSIFFIADSVVSGHWMMRYLSVIV